MFEKLRALPSLLATTPLALMVMTATAHAQGTPGDPNAAPATQPPGADEMTGELMFFTLGAGLLIAIVATLYFLRSRSNRAAAERVFNPTDRDRQL